MVAAMYLDVAIKAGSVKSPVIQHTIYRLTWFTCAPRLKLARVPHIGMASLAEVGHLCF